MSDSIVNDKNKRNYDLAGKINIFFMCGTIALDINM